MSIILGLLSVVCAPAPILAFLMVVWWLDRHEREPLWLFGLTFAWGAIGSIFLALIGNQAMASGLAMAIGPEQADQLSAVLVAPLVEEPMKALVLFAVMFSRHFDNATDGFVYGAAAGLGFGMTENLFYFFDVAAAGDPAQWLTVVVIRTFFSAVMHACATSCVGAMLGFARFRGTFAKVAALPVGFGIAMGIHALWNGLITLGSVLESSLYSTANFVVFPFEVMFLLGVFQLALWEERACIRRELADEVQQGLLPLAHATAIASYWARGRKGWVPKGVPQQQYVRAGITLALRKHQCRNASSRSYRFYSDDVLRLRREVQALLALAEGPKVSAARPR